MLNYYFFHCYQVLQLKYMLCSNLRIIPNKDEKERHSSLSNRLFKCRQLHQTWVPWREHKMSKISFLVLAFEIYWLISWPSQYHLLEKIYFTNFILEISNLFPFLITHSPKHVLDTLITQSLSSYLLACENAS